MSHYREASLYQLWKIRELIADKDLDEGDLNWLIRWTEGIIFDAPGNTADKVIRWLEEKKDR